MSIPRALPSNANDREILDHVHHHYPELGPVLKQMFDRFNDLESNGLIESDEKDGVKDDGSEDPVEAAIRTMNEEGVKCPHCGGEVEVKAPTDEQT